jgi:hypothetical protein
MNSIIKYVSFYVFWLLVLIGSVVFVSFAITGCSDHSVGGQVASSVPTPTPKVDCSVVQTDTGATISCPDGSTAKLTNGSNGAQGAQGISGLQGPVGPSGPQGIPGLNGTNGTQIYMVQLCSGFTPTYPSVFPEYIEQIGTKDYGVYSANGGFWSYLPPGYYSSNGINASCSFTINVDGSITN